MSKESRIEDQIQSIKDGTDYTEHPQSRIEAMLSDIIKNGTSGGGGGGSSITVDSQLSETSTNPVQNKVVADEINKLKTNKADLKSPNFTGVPTAPTPDIQANSIQIATTAFVKAVISALINGAPETADTLQELFDLIENNKDAVDILNKAIGKKFDKTGGIVGTDDEYIIIDPLKISGDSNSIIENFYDISANIINGGTLKYNDEDTDNRYLKKSDYTPVNTENFLSRKTGGIVNNNFQVNKVSTTDPSNLMELDIHNDGKVAILTSSKGSSSDSLVHFDGKSKEITIGMGAKILFSLLTNIYAKDGIQVVAQNDGINLVHNSLDAGIHINDDTVYINEGNDGCGAKFESNYEKASIYGNDIKIGYKEDFFMEMSRNKYNGIYIKDLKIRGGDNASISINGSNEITLGSDLGVIILSKFNEAFCNIFLKMYSDTLEIRLGDRQNGNGIYITNQGILPTDNDVLSLGSDECPWEYLHLMEAIQFDTSAFVYGDGISSKSPYYYISVKMNTKANPAYNLTLQNNGGNAFDVFPTKSTTQVQGVFNLGTANNKWTNVYATNGTIQTSDRNEKNTVYDLSLENAEKLIMGAIPKTYRMNNGSSGRTHWGLISQDFEELLKDLGWSSLDFAGFIKSPKEVLITEDENGEPLKEPKTKVVEGEYTYSLRYDEFIAPIIKVVQSQQKKIQSLEERISKLEALLSNT